MDLVILAAGMGSRFGGLKQLEPIDCYNNFIIDYSIYDALRAGFDRVVFIIKKENYEVFKNTVGSRVEKHIEVSYAFQELSLLPSGYSLPIERTKPLGTAQAILACKGLIKDSFIIINADDFYGKDAYEVAASFLKSLDSNSKNKYGNIAYQVKNTITENGSVKRGVLSYDENRNLTDLVESNIEKDENGKLIATPLDETKEKFIVDDSTLVSMNMFCFSKDILDHIEENFAPFLDNHADNLEKCEYLIPDLVSNLIEEGKINCEVLKTTSVWQGITYKEDKPHVVEEIKKLMDQGEYKQGLW